MRVVKFQAENFQNLTVVEITPEGDIVTIGGENEQGKSAVLNAVWVALAGKAVAPPMLIRKGEQQCRLLIELGEGDQAELIVTRTFTLKEDGEITDTVKVESADGKQRYTKPQTVLNDLIGQLGFDPFSFVQMKPEAQAATLLEMVPLPIDLEELARFYESDYQNRRDLNREIDSLDSQIKAIPERDDLPETPPDRQALLDALSGAADTNGAIERARVDRERAREMIERIRGEADLVRQTAKRKRELAAEMLKEAEQLEAGATESDTMAGEKLAQLEALPPLDDPVDTAKLRDEVAAADLIVSALETQRRRAQLVADRAAKAAQAESYTVAMEGRKKARRDALAGAKMPIDGLGFAINDKGKAVVTYDGVPFEQASTAQQIKASIAIAMAANPDLRVLRIKDGSLLDKRSMSILRDMAAADDFQLWIEVVGTEGVGVIMEAGAIKGAPAAPEPAKKPAAKKAAAKSEGHLL